MLWLIASGIIFRCIIAPFTELGVDEVYYWVCSTHLQWNYFDHPPMVALMIKFFTFNLSLEQFEFFIRLGSIICCALSTFFIFKTGDQIHSEKAGFFASVFYNGSFYGSIISGLFVLPDSPQMLFWTASLFILSKIVRSNGSGLHLWILFGITTGLTIMSKIHGVFLWSGLILFILFYRRKWLRQFQIYLSAFISFLITLPFFLWNFKNDFITYRYHSGRVEGSFLQFRADSFFREIFGELFYNNPVNFVITIIAVIAFFRKKLNTENDFFCLSGFMALPMIFIVIILSMFNATFPHWSGPAYVTLIPLVAVYMVSKTGSTKKYHPSLKYSLGLMIVIVVAGVFFVNFYPGTLSNKKSISEFGERDFTLDMYGWKQASTQIYSIIKADEKNGIMSEQSELVSNKMFPAAHIYYYIARLLNKNVIGIGNLNDLHTFAWMNEYNLKNKKLTDAWCVVPSSNSCDVKTVYGNSFKTIDSVTTIPIYRGGKICKYFFVYRMKGFTGKVLQIK